MTLSESGKYLYWVAGETIDVKMTEMYNIRKYRKVEDYAVGEAKWKHFVKGESPITCTNDRKCPQCKAGLKPTIRFDTSVIFVEDGEEYYSELPISLSRIIAEKQVAFEEAGLDEDEILEKVFKIRKFDKVVAPYWEVKVVSDKAEKAKVKVKKKIAIEDIEDDEEDDDSTDAVVNEELSDEEVEQVEDLIAKIEVKLNKSPDYDWKALADKTLRKLFKEDWKVTEGMALIENALGDDADEDD